MLILLYNGNADLINLNKGAFLMRVISGKARGHKLFSPEGMHTRPTADRVKEAVFNVLMGDIHDSHILDLFSGSGALGIEALSRGAKSAVFVDNNAESIDIIRKNIEKTKLSTNSDIIMDDACSAVKSLGDLGRKFDVIFMDPPYYGNAVAETLDCICRSGILKDFGIICAEMASDQEFSFDDSMPLEIFKIKDYNIAKIVFLRKGQTF